MFRGFDLSALQGNNINFQELVASGITFIIHRCGIGNDGIDPMYRHNIQMARNAGLKVGAYHFIYPLPTDPSHTTRNPISQAQMHYKAAGDVSVIFVDAEWPEIQDWAKWSVNAEFIKDWTLKYLTEYERLSGRIPGLYTYPYYAKSLGLTKEFARYPLWIASYEPTPVIPFPWTFFCMWQTSGGGGKLPNGAPVDTDVCNDLSLWDNEVINQPIATLDQNLIEDSIVQPTPIIKLIPTQIIPPSLLQTIIDFFRKYNPLKFISYLVSYLYRMK